MNLIESKINKTSGRVSLLLKLASILMVLITILGILGICILTFSGSNTKESFVAAFTTTANNGASLTPQALFALFVSMILYSIVMCIIFYNIYLIFRDTKSERTPFRHKHAVRIKRISLLVIIMSLINSGSSSLFDLFTLNKMVWNIDFSGFFLGIIIYCLALFFDYGCELQKQSDETL